MDLFTAGTETASSTIIWCILLILHFPDVQTKIHEELDREVGLCRRPTMQDQSSLPYLRAVIKETQRLVSIVPFSLLHQTNEKITIGDYDIPKGTRVIPHLDSVLHDPHIWGPDVDVFRPERFLDNEGKVVHPEQFIPFSLGPRVCFGENMAKTELFLFLSSMFQRFRFECPDPENPPSLTPVIGLTAAFSSYKVVCLER
ncbi:cytochrome P450 2U1 [Elysia marginata]|uniref:Cytochrome P450 2U1 n=1 Tax=Elysia marginata TaxID=1093978 RepID=A0AAV4GUL5_9GAST|nr:cytochrome P450 2U1 [Elysia marginata]